MEWNDHCYIYIFFFFCFVLSLYVSQCVTIIGRLFHLLLLLLVLLCGCFKFVILLDAKMDDEVI